jgi:hypothetical protein
MEGQDHRLREIWRQTKLPVIYRQGAGSSILVKLPYWEGNFDWLRAENRHKPKWDLKFKCWKTPLSWFDDLVEKTLKKFDQVYVIQLYREHQKCAPACWNAQGYHCECSCMGANHGTGHPSGRWTEVAETFAFQWGERRYACRLIVAKDFRSKH